MEAERKTNCVFGCALSLLENQKEAKFAIDCGLTLLKSQREAKLSVAKARPHSNQRQPPPPHVPPHGKEVKFSPLKLKVEGSNFGKSVSGFHTMPKWCKSGGELLL